MDDLELFNRVARFSRPAHAEFTPLTTLDTPLADTGLDSMDTLMIAMFYADIYGVPELLAKELTYTTAAELIAQTKAHKTKEPSSLQEALESVSW